MVCSKDEWVNNLIQYVMCWTQLEDLENLALMECLDFVI
jgi:hypothetical protein